MAKTDWVVNTPKPPKLPGAPPIPLSDSKGRVFGYACPRCLHVRAGVEGCGTGIAGMRRRAEESLKQATDCCRCRRCKKTLTQWKYICAACEAIEDSEKEAFYKTPKALKRKADAEAARATFDTSPNPAAARLLARAMSDVSEALWCAGWFDGTEYDLWPMLSGWDRAWGMGEVSESSVQELRLLSEQAGGWVIYGDGGETFVPMAEWVEMFERRHRQ